MLIRIPKNLFDKVEFCSIEDRVARIIPGVTLSKTEMEEFEEFKDYLLSSRRDCFDWKK